MKKQFFKLTSLLVMAITANAQAEIGTTIPHASSILKSPITLGKGISFTNYK